MENSKRWLSLMVLTSAGFVISVYQTIHFHLVRSGSAGFKTFCNISETLNCEAVGASRFAELAWNIPLSAAAAGWYLALLIILLMGRDRLWRQEATRAAAVFAGWAVIMTAIYFSIMAFSLGVFCLLCLVIDGINIALLAIVLSLKPASLKDVPLDRGKWKGIVIASLVCVFGGLAFGKITGSQGGQLSDNEVKQVIQRIMGSEAAFIETLADTPKIGPADAPIKIVKFSDLQCPACQRGAYALHPVMNRYKDKIQFTFRHFPLDPACNREIKRPLHPYACLAARYLHCATEQDRFEKVYHHIFENQRDFSKAMLEAMVYDIELDATAMESCMSSGRATMAITRDVEEGLRLEVQSTPTFFMNGKRITGGLPPQIWEQLIQAALENQ